MTISPDRPMTILRIAALALLASSAAACGPGEPEAAEALPAHAAAAEAPPPAPAAEAETAPAAVFAEAHAGPGAPAGYYECYFHGDYGLQNSSLVSLRIHGPAEYEALEERGRYAMDGTTVRMETGPLAGRVAHVRESSGKPALVFVRKENEGDGKPTIDISDTWCYFEPR